MTAAIVQQGRFVFPGDDPLGDRARYVVTVTNRSRDLGALGRLSPAVAALVTPSIRLIHLAGPVERVSDRRVRDWASGIRHGVGGPWYWYELTGFDPLQPTARSGRHHRVRRGPRPAPGRPLLLALATDLQKGGHRPTPVVRVGPMGERLRNLIVTVGHGAANGLGLAVEVGADPSQVDVLLELPVDRGLRLTPAQLAATVQRARAIAPWRNLVVLGSGVPAIIARPGGATGPDADSDDPSLIVVERPDWTDHRELTRLLADAGVAPPTFGDYGTRHPLRLAWAGTKRANLRYTAGGLSLVAMGEATRNGRAPGAHFARLCRAVADQPGFRGSDHCWGCARIAAGAEGDPDDVPRLQSAWDTVGLVHHITEVVGATGPGGGHA